MWYGCFGVNTGEHRFGEINMRILFTICGRAGSKGIKNKNLRWFCGRYLAYYSMSVIDLFLRRHSDIGYDIVVNSDSQELLSIISNNGLREVTPIVREEALSGDSIGKIAVVSDCLSKMRDMMNCLYDIVVDLDITSPLRTVEDLEKVISVHQSTGADVTTTVATARRNPYFNQVKRTGHGVRRVIESDFTARQQAPEIYDLNASIYAYNPQYLNTGKGVLEGYCEIVEMYDTGILDLDHENDFVLMELIANYLIKNNDGFRKVYENIPNKE